MCQYFDIEPLFDVPLFLCCTIYSALHDVVLFNVPLLIFALLYVALC